MEIYIAVHSTDIVDCCYI